jgi:hypothetical protein
MSECVPHSGATSRQRISSETFAEPLDVRSHQHPGEYCKPSLLDVISKLHCWLSHRGPTLELDSKADQHDAGED